MTINKYLGNNERMNFAIQELEKKDRGSNIGKWKNKPKKDTLFFQGRGEKKRRKFQKPPTTLKRKTSYKYFQSKVWGIGMEIGERENEQAEEQ